MGSCKKAIAWDAQDEKEEKLVCLLLGTLNTDIKEAMQEYERLRISRGEMQ